ncbi:uncharacterized protein DUF4349 [Ruminiclostridium sufflavum DSM 19573]|uniref:Uncharacterized protein DUF4349 n=1 Tax=Ruminiclostridium sufflavum DSM 19573 TaxID=1121337 RepID=A0A318XPC3_9FIRM|nr:DUF4349 domain-containing protein [Ruminiclostridium sufflavum]PYG88790.1 uncharacterized protein DUF4349 [Ruminiclostridium sufflavum DSM 19573]
MYRKLIIWILMIAVSVSMAGCGSTASKSETSKKDIALTFNDSMDAGSAQSGEGAAETLPASSSQAESNNVNEQSTDNIAGVNQKIIFTGQVNLETLDFEKTKTDLCQYISSAGGFIQSSTVQGSGIGYGGLKSAEYVFRIPKAGYNQAFIDLRKFGTVVLEQSNGEDVTERYFDTEARLKSLKIQQERLQELLKKADKMEDILKIEKELQTTLYEIENCTGTLKKWDSLVEYSTLNVNISEVEQIKPAQPKEKDGFFHRLAYSFKNSVAGIGVFLQASAVLLAAAVPVIVPLGLIGYLIFRLAKRKARGLKDNENKEK